VNQGDSLSVTGILIYSISNVVLRYWAYTFVTPLQYCAFSPMRYHGGRIEVYGSSRRVILRNPDCVELLYSSNSRRLQCVRHVTAWEKPCLGIAVGWVIATNVWSRKANKLTVLFYRHIWVRVLWRASRKSSHWKLTKTEVLFNWHNTGIRKGLLIVSNILVPILLFIRLNEE